MSKENNGAQSDTVTADQVIAACEKSLEQAIEKYDGQVKQAGTAAEEVRAEVKSLAGEHAELIKANEKLAAKFGEFEQLVATSAGGNHGPLEKSWGEQMAGPEGLGKILEGGQKSARIAVKNTILGEGGSPQNPQNILVPADRMAGIVPGAFRSLNLLDVIPTGVTGSNQIEYTREATYTNNAAETAEGATKPESVNTFELVTDPVRTIAHFIKLSKQVLDDAPALQSYVDRRLRHGLRQRLETQILLGNATGSNISGLNQSGRHTAFTPSTGENQFDSLNRAKYAIYGAEYVPNAIFLNPADWGAIERIKTGVSGDNSYVAGDGGAMSYVNNGLQPMIWGLPVIPSNAVTAGKFFVLDTNAMQLFMRQGATVEMFEQDDTNVQQNLITVRAELRAASAVFTPTAIRYGDLVIA